MINRAVGRMRIFTKPADYAVCIDVVQKVKEEMLSQYELEEDPRKRMNIKRFLFPFLG